NKRASLWGGSLSSGRAVLRGRFLQVVDHVGQFFLLLDAREDHLVARDVTLRIGEIRGQGFLVPGDALVLHGIGVLEVFHGAGLAPEQAGEAGTDALLAGFELMAGLALRE